MGGPGPFLAGGAVLYALCLGGLGATFDLTPLFLGSVVLVAAVAGGRLRLVRTALVLIGWGLAVMAVRHGPLPDIREAPAFLVGAGLGLVVATLVARARPGQNLGDGGTALVLGGLAFYLAFDEPWLVDWPFWAVATAAWAAWEWWGRPVRRFAGGG